MTNLDNTKGHNKENGDRLKYKQMRNTEESRITEIKSGMSDNNNNSANASFVAVDDSAKANNEAVNDNDGANSEVVDVNWNSFFGNANQGNAFFGNDNNQGNSFIGSAHHGNAFFSNDKNQCNASFFGQCQQSRQCILWRSQSWQFIPR